MTKSVTFLPPGAGDIPLRLRKRADGTVGLADERGALDGGANLPKVHLFTFDWLAGAGASIAVVSGDIIKLSLINCTAVYEIVTSEPKDANGVSWPGLLCRLKSKEPKKLVKSVDYGRALDIQRERMRQADIRRDKETVEIASGRIEDIKTILKGKE